MALMDHVHTAHALAKKHAPLAAKLLVGLGAAGAVTLVVKKASAATPPTPAPPTPIPTPPTPAPAPSVAPSTVYTLPNATPTSLGGGVTNVVENGISVDSGGMIGQPITGTSTTVTSDEGDTDLTVPGSDG